MSQVARRRTAPGDISMGDGSGAQEVAGPTLIGDGMELPTGPMGKLSDRGRLPARTASTNRDRRLEVRTIAKW